MTHSCHSTVLTLLHWHGGRTLVVRLQILADVGKLWCTSTKFILVYVGPQEIAVGAQHPARWNHTRNVCRKAYRYLALVTCLRSTGTWYSPGPSAGENHLPLVLVYHHVRQRVTGLLFFVVRT